MELSTAVICQKCIVFFREYEASVLISNLPGKAWRMLFELHLNSACVLEAESGKLYQGLHRLEKYMNIQDCLEKSLKIKFALKSNWKTLKGLENSLNFTIYRRIQQCFWRPKSV